MSKIGKLPIKLTEGVTAQREDGKILVSGPKGSITLRVPSEVEIRIDAENLSVLLKEKNKEGAAIHGTTRALLANAVLGVSQGFTKQLELVGTGFRAEVNGQTLVLTIGYSHTVSIEAPSGVVFKVEKNIITVHGPDKEIVGQIAAKIRAARPPEPYKGKGIKYVNEIIRRKAGKAAKTVGTAV